MKFQPDKFERPVHHGLRPGWIASRPTHHAQLRDLLSAGERPWHCSGSRTDGRRTFAPWPTLGAELVIFGSGNRIRFPQPAWLAA
jgi:hypothetical protein